MALIRTGAGGDAVWDLDPTYKAGPISFRAPEYQSGGQGGQFRTRLTSGTITAGQAAGGILFSFRNPTSYQNIVVYNVTMGFAAIAGNTAGSVVCSLYFTRSFTATDATGAASPTTPFLLQRMDPTSNYQMQADFRIVNTTTLSGGTGNDDSQPLSGLVFNVQGSIAPMPLQSFFSGFPVYSSATQNITGIVMPQFPLIFAQNEGFRIRNDTAFAGGTDTEALVVVVEWAEMPTTGAGF